MDGKDIGMHLQPYIEDLASKHYVFCSQILYNDFEKRIHLLEADIRSTIISLGEIFLMPSNSCQYRNG